MGGRLVDVVANTSKVCTSERGIIERSFRGVFGMKLSGNKFPISHQLTEASGTQPTPDIPKIGIWLDVMAVFRRMGTPYMLKYDLAPGVTYSDHGRDLLFRLTKENPLCNTKGLVFNRPNIFGNVTNTELTSGPVRMGNLLDPTFTELPMLTRQELMGITLGPLSVDASFGYMTGFHEEDVLMQQHQLANYQDPAHYHQQSSQVKMSNITGTDCVQLGT